MCNLKRADGNLCNTSSLQKEMRAWGCWGSGKLLKIWWHGKEACPDRLPCKYVSQKERLIWGLSSSWHRVYLCTFPLQISVGLQKESLPESLLDLQFLTKPAPNIPSIFGGIIFLSAMIIFKSDGSWSPVTEHCGKKRIGRQSSVYAVIKKLRSVGPGICL